jgi:hypothetical protein
MFAHLKGIARTPPSRSNPARESDRIALSISPALQRVR